MPVLVCLLHVHDVAPQTSGYEWLLVHLKSIQHTTWFMMERETRWPTPIPVYYIQDNDSLDILFCTQMSGYTTIWPTNNLCSPPWHTEPMSSYKTGLSPQYILIKCRSNQQILHTQSTWEDYVTMTKSNNGRFPYHALAPPQNTSTRYCVKHVMTAGLPLRKAPAYFSPSRMTQP
jgi:hypothetical protein